ncbi:hypothetical protein Tco_1153052 [Tanacetum coccineum]
MPLGWRIWTDVILVILPTVVDLMMEKDKLSSLEDTTVPESFSTQFLRVSYAVMPLFVPLSAHPMVTDGQPIVQSENTGTTALSGQATTLPHAFNTETLQYLSSGAWNMDTGRPQKILYVDTFSIGYPDLGNICRTHVGYIALAFVTLDFRGTV